MQDLKKGFLLIRGNILLTYFKRQVYLTIELNTKLQDANPEEVKDKGRYQRLVGRLIYLSHIRPDIAFAVSMTSQFMHSPGPIHFEAVYKICRYLK